MSNSVGSTRRSLFLRHLQDSGRQTGRETVNDFHNVERTICLTLSSSSLPVSPRLSAHKGVMQLAGRDTLTSIGAEVCRATHTHSQIPLTVPTAGQTPGCLFNY